MSVSKSTARATSLRNTVAWYTVSCLLVKALRSPPTRSRKLLICVEVRRVVPLKLKCSKKCAIPLSASGSWRVPAHTT